MMKIFLILLVTSVIVIGGPKEDLLQVRNETHFKLTTERLALVKKDTDLSILHNNILRTHGKLAAALAKHPEMKKNPKSAAEMKSSAHRLHFLPQPVQFTELAPNQFIAMLKKPRITLIRLR
jgi:hypothetical protein